MDYFKPCTYFLSVWLFTTKNIDFGCQLVITIMYSICSEFAIMTDDFTAYFNTHQKRLIMQNERYFDDQVAT